jgi:hypothetical protein
LTNNGSDLTIGTRALSGCLNGGTLAAALPATQVAEYAGHSAHVLLKVDATCIKGQDEAARRRIEDALEFLNTLPGPGCLEMRPRPFLRIFVVFFSKSGQETMGEVSSNQRPQRARRIHSLPS